MTKNKPFLILNVALLAIALVGQCYEMIGSSIGNGLVGEILNVAAIGEGLLYVFYGYKKSAAKYYKAYMILLALSALIWSMLVGIQRDNPLSIFCNNVMFASICVLAFAENMKRTKSLIFGLVAFLMSVVNVVGVMITTPGFGPVLSFACTLVLVINMNLMIVAKFRDKEERGREV